MAIGTLAERTTRFTTLLHLPRMHGHGIQPRVKNGPALAGYGAEAMREAIAATIVALPEQLRRSLTWDRGKELAQHAQPKIDTGIAVYFAGPHSRPRKDTRPKSSTSTYAQPERPVLRRPVESGKYTSIAFPERLAAAGIDPSVGSVGDAAETIIGPFKTELINARAQWRTAEQVEIAILKWADWFNHRRLLEACGDIPRRARSRPLPSPRCPRRGEPLNPTALRTRRRGSRGELHPCRARSWTQRGPDIE